MLQPIRFVVSLFLLMSFMAACGGGSSSPSGTGKAKILLTDRYEEKITDREGNLIKSAKEIWVTFSHMALKPVKGEWISVFNAPPEEPVSFDLLTLRGKTELLALVDLPLGAYDKARMEIEEAWFIDAEGVRHDVKVPSGKITIKFKRHLVIREDDTTEVLFDFIPGKSIHLIETGGGKFILRPVIRVKVLGEEVTEFVKIEGEIVSVNCGADQLVLDPDHGGPITVYLENALIISEEGSFSEWREDDEDEREKGEANIGSCAQLVEGETVEVVGTSGDEEGVIHASLIRIEDEKEGSNRLEFTGTLLEVDCIQGVVRVTFSGGEIEVTVRPETEIFTADDQAIPASEVCDRLNGAVGQPIDLEGKVENSRVIATEITLPSGAPAPI